jgi:hypothetical protein
VLLIGVICWRQLTADNFGVPTAYQFAVRGKLMPYTYSDSLLKFAISFEQSDYHTLAKKIYVAERGSSALF